MTADQGVVYATFIEEQLAWEKARQISLDERGSRLQQTVGLTSGLLVAGTGAISPDVGTISVPGKVLLALTFIFLASAFVLGSIATRLHDYEVADAKAMFMMVNEKWDHTATSSRNVTAYLNIKSVDSLRSGNDKKAQTLQRGIVAQGVGAGFAMVTFVAVALPSSSLL